MAALPDVRKEKYAQFVADGAPLEAAYRRAFGSGDLVVFYQIKTSPDVIARIAELS